MKQGIVGLIILLLGAVIIAILFVISQTKVIEKGVSSKDDTQKVKQNVDEIQKKLQLEQEKSLEQNP